MGSLQIPLTNVTLLKFGRTGNADAVSLKNGDKLQGEVRLPTITVETLFGNVSLSKEILLEIQVQLTGNAQHLEWELLPYPKNSDWPGDRGRAAEVRDDGTVILHGQPVLSKQTFSLPLTIECDVSCPEPSFEDGGITFAAFEPSQPTDVNPREIVGFHYGYRNRGEIWGGLLCWQITNGDKGKTIWGERRVDYAPGKTCHLRLTLTTEGSQLQLNETSYDLERVIVPYDRFKLHIEGWRTSDPWRVSNFTVH